MCIYICVTNYKMVKAMVIYKYFIKIEMNVTYLYNPILILEYVCNWKLF